MQNKVIKEFGIGNLINCFENEKEQNIETFNKLFFNCKLNGFDPKLSVAIGEYNKGMREIKIGDTITLERELTLMYHAPKRVGDNFDFILTTPDGIKIGIFKNMKQAANFLDFSYGYMRSCVVSGKYMIEEIDHD